MSNVSPNLKSEMLELFGLLFGMNTKSQTLGEVLLSLSVQKTVDVTIIINGVKMCRSPYK